MRNWRLKGLRKRGPVYVAVSPTGRDGWPFAHKRAAQFVARWHARHKGGEWTVNRYGNRRDA